MKYSINSIRLACTVGSTIVTIKSLEEMEKKYFKELQISGIVIDSTTPNIEAKNIIKESNTVIIHNFNPEKWEEYCDRCYFYLEKYGLSKEAGTALSGPGMIAILESNHYSAYQEKLKKIEKILFERLAANNQLIQEILYQPIMIKITNLNMEGLRLAINLYEDFFIDGFIFEDISIKNNFYNIWSDYSTKKRQLLIFFSGALEEIISFFERNNSCDGFILKELPDKEQIEQMIDSRIKNIFEMHKKRIFLAKSRQKLRIGIAAIQGAYHLEKILCDSLQDDLPYDFETIFIHTKEEMEFFDCVVLGGGWHSPQYDFYNKTGILDGVRCFGNNGQHALFSCAGAILAREPGKMGEGCSSNAAGFMDYGIKNNAINGVQNFFIQGKAISGKFIGAPLFVDIAQHIEIVGRLSDGIPVVLKEKKDSGSIFIATSTHSRIVFAHWLNDIVKQDARWGYIKQDQLSKIEEKIQD